MTTFFVKYPRPNMHLNGAVSMGMHVCTVDPARAIATAERIAGMGATDVQVCTSEWTCTHSKPREVGVCDKISDDLGALGGYREIALSTRCGFGCKVYYNADLNDAVVAHNSSYGCRVGA